MIVPGSWFYCWGISRNSPAVHLVSAYVSYALGEGYPIRAIMEVQEGAKLHTSNRTIPLSKDALLLLENLMGNSKHPNGFI